MTKASKPAKPVMAWALKWNGEIAPDWTRSTRKLSLTEKRDSDYLELTGPIRVEIRPVAAKRKVK